MLLMMDHFQLDPNSRMRNKLAEDILYRKMLILMKVDCFLLGTFKIFIYLYVCIYVMRLCNNQGQQLSNSAGRTWT